MTIPYRRCAGFRSFGVVASGARVCPSWFRASGTYTPPLAMTCRKACSAIGVCWDSLPISNRTITLVSSVVSTAAGSGDGAVQVLYRHHATRPGAVAEEILRLEAGGSVDQPPVAIDSPLNSCSPSAGKRLISPCSSLSKTGGRSGWEGCDPLSDS